MEDYPPLPRGKGVDGGLPPPSGEGGMAAPQSMQDAMPESAPMRGSEGSRWSELFHVQSLNSGGFDLHYDAPLLVEGRRIARCASTLLEEGIQQWKLALIGHFIGRRPAYSQVQTSVLQQWKIVGNVKIVLLENDFFVFKFSLQEDMLKVLEVGLWSVMGRPLILRPWSPRQNLKRINLSSLPVWIRLPNLPFQYWTAKALSVIGSVLGRPIASDAQTKVQDRLSYAKLCVEIDAHCGFPSSIPIHDEDGFVFEQEVQYEWKPPLCSQCKVFGHSSSQCGAAFPGRVRKVWRPKSVPVEDSGTTATRAAFVQVGEAVPPAQVVDQLEENVGKGRNLNAQLLRKERLSIGTESNMTIPVSNVFESLANMDTEDMDLSGEINENPAVPPSTAPRMVTPIAEFGDLDSTSNPTTYVREMPTNTVVSSYGKPATHKDPFSLQPSPIALSTTLNDGCGCEVREDYVSKSMDNVGTGFFGSKFISHQMGFLNDRDARSLLEALQEDPAFNGADMETSADMVGSDFCEGNTCVRNTCVSTPQNQDAIEDQDLPILTERTGVGDVSPSANLPQDIPKTKIGKNRKTKKKNERVSIKDFIEAGLDEIVTVDGENDDVGPSSEEEGAVFATSMAENISSTTLLRRSHRFRRPSDRLKDL